MFKKESVENKVQMMVSFFSSPYIKAAQILNFCHKTDWPVEETTNLFYREKGITYWL